MSMQSDINVLSISLGSDIILLIDLPLFIMSKNYYIYKTLFSLTLWVFIFMHEINENHGNFRDEDNC